MIGEQFLNGAPSALVLGDNIFYGHDFQKLLAGANAQTTGATVFAYHVQDPERYGVAEFDAQGKVLSLEENLQFRSPTTRSLACISMTARWWTLPSRSSLRHVVSWKLPT